MKYELTITIKPQYYKFRSEEQFLMASGQMTSLLEGYDCSVVAELTQMENVHFHCLVILDSHSHKSKLLHSIRNTPMFGKCSCSQIVDYNKYVMYMRKDIDKTHEILHRWPVVKDTLQILTNKLYFVTTPQGEVYICDYSDSEVD